MEEALDLCGNAGVSCPRPGLPNRIGGITCGFRRMSTPVFSADWKHIGSVKDATSFTLYVLRSQGDMVYISRRYVTERGDLLVLSLPADALDHPQFGRPPLDTGTGLPPL